MKLSLNYFSILLLAICLSVGCRGNTNVHPIVGTWVSANETIEFSEEGHYVLMKNDGTFEGTYTITEGGKMLTFSSDGSNHQGFLKSRFGLVDGGNRLIIEHSFTGTVSLTRVRKNS